MSLMLLLAACGPQEKACDSGTLYTPIPTDCAALSSRTDWSIGTSSAEIELFVGLSRRVSLSPYSIFDCQDRATVTWRIDDEQVANVVPDPTFNLINAWVTGLAPGATRLTARIRFSDGVERETAPTAVRTAPPDPPTVGSLLLAEGAIEIAEGTAPTTRWYFVSFRLPEPGRVDMTTLQPGEYALRLDYSNAAAVLLRYGVRLTPSRLAS